MHRSTRRFWSFLLASLLAGSLWGQADPGEQLVRLDTHLEKIRKEYESARIIGGLSLTGSGLTIGAVGTAVSYSSFWGLSSDSAGLLATISWGYASVLIVPGVVTFLLKSDYETMPERFAKTAAETDDQIRYKVAQGEVALQGLSDKARFDRMFTAGVLALGGGAMLYLANQTPSYQASSPYDYGYRTPDMTTSPYFSTGLIYLGTAVIRALLASTPENENQSYLRWKQTTQ